MTARIIRGDEAERRRLYAYDGQDRSHKRHLSLAQSVAVLAFAAGLLLGGLFL